MHPVPSGTPGELFIGGDGVARGYFNRPELTNERFVPNPFSSDPDSKLYRTGDLVRYLQDGRVAFLGRVDYQVKIRGFRIELGEIETALMRHESVRDVVVVARENGVGDPTLAAYYVPVNGEPAGERALRAHLETGLPDYMIPSAFVPLEALPLTPNGKVDRKTLPEPGAAAVTASETVNYQPPASGLEETIAAVWQEALSRPRIGVQDNFFDLGAHSITVMQVNGKLREALNRDISLIDLFRYPTVRSLAKHLSAGDDESADTQGADRARMRQRMMGQRRNLKRMDATAAN
jgi:acyl carrier protein